jgi:ABC-2 type transport system permease protein
MIVRELQGIITIAYRDFTKLMRDKYRLLASLIFPLIFIGVLGGGLGASLAGRLPFEYLPFVFVGVFAQTMFQSAAAGVISLIQDRENDFSKELFVAPVSRYSIIFGKILGESLVAMTQGVGIVIMGVLFGASLTLVGLLTMLPVALFAAIVGGAFGILIVANASEVRTANQFFPFLIFPQLFLSGVFSPVHDFPRVLEWISYITPMRYPVDLMRSVYYAGTPEYAAVVTLSPVVNLLITGVILTAFLLIGTRLFIKKEREK